MNDYPFVLRPRGPPNLRGFDEDLAVSGICECLWTILNEMQLKFSGANVCEYKSVRLVHNWKTSFTCLVRLQDLCITLGVLWF